MKRLIRKANVTEQIIESNENNIDLSEYEYISHGTGYNRGWNLYRKMVDGKGIWVAKHQETNEIVPINYDQVQGFEPIRLDGVKKLSKELGDMLLPKRESNLDNNITFEEIKQQLKSIDTHPHLKIYYDENPFLNNCSVTIEGTLINGEPICFHDSSYLRTQSDIDFIKEQYAKAIEKIEHMHKIGYEGVKD